MLNRQWLWVICLAFLGILWDRHAQKISRLEKELKLQQETISVLPQVQSDLQALTKTNERLDLLEGRQESQESLQSRIETIESVYPKKTQIVEDIPFAHFSFDNMSGFSVKDVGVGKNDLISPQELKPLNVPGVFKEGIYFNGQNTVISLQPLLKSIRQDMVGTISLWIKNEADSGGTIMSFADNESPTAFVISREELSYKNIVFGFEGNWKYSWLFFIRCSTQEDSWLHLSLVQDGIFSKTYCNGEYVPVFKYNQEVNHRAWFYDYPVFENGYIGAHKTSNIDLRGFYKGVIDDFRYYRRPLVPTEIRYLYQEGIKALSTKPTPTP